MIQATSVHTRVRHRLPTKSKRGATTDFPKTNRARSAFGCQVKARCQAVVGIAAICVSAASTSSCTPGRQHDVRLGGRRESPTLYLPCPSPERRRRSRDPRDDPRAGGEIIRASNVLKSRAADLFSRPDAQKFARTGVVAGVGSGPARSDMPSLPCRRSRALIERLRNVRPHRETTATSREQLLSASPRAPSPRSFGLGEFDRRVDPRRWIARSREMIVIQVGDDFTMDRQALSADVVIHDRFEKC